jgi:hypothetical protein
MSAFAPSNAFMPDPDPDHPQLRQRPRSPDEQRARWEVRAAQWRAHELAEHIFGSVSSTGLSGIRGEGPFRGLMRLEVPFSDLGAHREREARFLSAVGEDPLLAGVPLVFVIGPDAA